MSPTFPDAPLGISFPNVYEEVHKPSILITTQVVNGVRVTLTPKFFPHKDHTFVFEPSGPDAPATPEEVNGYLLELNDGVAGTHRVCSSSHWDARQVLFDVIEHLSAGMSPSRAMEEIRNHPRQIPDYD